MKDYQNTINVSTNPQTTFDEITKNMTKWWSTTTSKFLQPGDEATVTFNNNKTSWIFRAEELNPPHLVVLRCIKSDHIHDGLSSNIKEEWLNTRLIFNIKSTKEGSEVEFKHEGLRPELECHEVCKQGWDHFFGESLRRHLNSLSK